MVYPFKISCTFDNNKSIFIKLLLLRSLLPFFTVLPYSNIHNGHFPHSTNKQEVENKKKSQSNPTG